MYLAGSLFKGNSHIGEVNGASSEQYGGCLNMNPFLTDRFN